MPVHLPPKHHIVNCAGQVCPERGECLRYLRHAQWPRKDYETGKTIVQAWASYDIERQRCGSCESKLVPVGQVARAMMRAA